MIILIKMDSTNYVYLLQEREFLKTSEQIYKIGKTTKLNHQRFNQYPKGSVLMFQMMCENCNLVEKQIMTSFRLKYKQRKDIGTEYFEGSPKEMIEDIFQLIKEIENNPFGKNDEDVETSSDNDDDNYIEDRSKCFTCGGSGTSYWSDDCYGSCLECRCINCKEFNDECECKYCKKCESSFMKDKEHKCYLCEKCGKYEQ